MSSQENKEVATRYYEQVYNRGNLDVACEVLHPEYVQRSLHYSLTSPDMLQGPQAIKRQAAAMRAAYPDFHYSIKSMIAEGEIVMVCGTVSGTHSGETRGVTPTGKRITFTSIHILRFEQGQIVEDWNLWDALGWWQQMGVVPQTTELQHAGTRRSAAGTGQPDGDQGI